MCVCERVCVRERECVCVVCVCVCVSECCQCLWAALLCHMACISVGDVRERACVYSDAGMCLVSCDV